MNLKKIDLKQERKVNPACQLCKRSALQSSVLEGLANTTINKLQRKIVMSYVFLKTVKKERIKIAQCVRLGGERLKKKLMVLNRFWTNDDDIREGDLKHSLYFINFCYVSCFLSFTFLVWFSHFFLLFDIVAQLINIESFQTFSLMLQISFYLLPCLNP